MKERGMEKFSLDLLRVVKNIVECVSVWNLQSVITG